MSTRDISLRGKSGQANNFTTLMCRLSGNLGVLTSWNLQGLYRDILYFHCTQLIGVLRISNNDVIHDCVCISDIINMVKHLKDHDGIYA